MNSLINALKTVSKKVSELDYTNMTLEEVNEIKEKVNQYIKNIQGKDDTNV